MNDLQLWPRPVSLKHHLEVSFQGCQYCHIPPELVLQGDVRDKQ